MAWSPPVNVPHKWEYNTEDVVEALKGVSNIVAWADSDDPALKAFFDSTWLKLEVLRQELDQLIKES